MGAPVDEDVGEQVEWVVPDVGAAEVMGPVVPDEEEVEAPVEEDEGEKVE